MAPPPKKMAHFAQIDSIPAEYANFRTVLWTGEGSQLVVMTVPVGGDIGEEVSFILPRYSMASEGFCRNGEGLYDPVTGGKRAERAQTGLTWRQVDLTLWGRCRLLIGDQSPARTELRPGAPRRPAPHLHVWHRESHRRRGGEGSSRGGSGDRPAGHQAQLWVASVLLDHADARSLVYVSIIHIRSPLPYFNTSTCTVRIRLTSSAIVIVPRFAHSHLFLPEVRPLSTSPRFARALGSTVINTGPTPLCLFTVYAPAEHAENTVHKTKEEGDKAEDEGKDEAPEWSQKSK